MNLLFFFFFLSLSIQYEKAGIIIAVFYENAVGGTNSFIRNTDLFNTVIYRDFSPHDPAKRINLEKERFSLFIYTFVPFDSHM